MNWGQLGENIGDIIKYGSRGGKEYALAEEERLQKAKEEAKKIMESEERAAEREQAIRDKVLMDYYNQLVKQELDKIKIQKERLSLMEQAKKIFETEAKETESGSKPSPTPTPTATPTATPTPTAKAMEEFLIDYLPYIEDQGKIDAYYPQGIPQPPPQLLDIIRQVSPDDATRSAIIKLTESSYNMNPPDHVNADNSVDRGTNMVNSKTFDWLRGTPYSQMMEKSGIENYGDMFDPMKNENMMDIIRRAQGYGAWYGPPNRGFNLLKRK